jgi:hypothetical protein
MPDLTDKVTVRIENYYSDGHESKHEVEVEFNNAVYSVFSDDDIEEWFQDVVFDHTGDGHGDGSHGKLGSCYVATVLKAETYPELVGKNTEWVD